MIWLAYLALLGVCLLGAWVEHSDRSREDASYITATVSALGWKMAALAELLDLRSEKDLINALAGRQGLNHWRFAALPDEFHAKYDALKAGARGAVVLEAPQIQLVHGFAAMDRPHMVKMTRPVVLPLGREIA